LLADPRWGNERADPAAHDEHSLANEILSGLTKRGSAHAIPFAQLQLRWQRLAWPKLAALNQPGEILLDLTMKCEAASWIDRGLRPTIGSAGHVELLMPRTRTGFMLY
jgi:hypothetical protein